MLSGSSLSQIPAKFLPAASVLQGRLKFHEAGAAGLGEARVNGSSAQRIFRWPDPEVRLWD